MPTTNWKRQRNIETRQLLKKHYYIFCEGKKTEPNYFTSMKDRIEANAMYKNAVTIKIKGVGEGTLKIIDQAETYVAQNSITNAEIWLVYDKDEFSAEDFNYVAVKANRLNDNEKGNEYRVAWSNQCIEYWFILHFDYYSSDNDRSYYIKYLDSKFKKVGAGKYTKNDANIFDKLEKYGNPKQAIKFAENRLKEFSGQRDSETVPATKVHLLYSELKQYLDNQSS